MASNASRTQFEWSYTEEPHASRRRIILRKYPEIKKLFGFDPSFIYVVIAMTLTQIFIAYILRNADWLLIFLQVVFTGAVFNTGLFYSIHEMVHNIAFGAHQPLKNRLFGFLANLPLLIPISASYKKYHIEHHRYLGEDGLDTDLPSEFEAKLFTNTWTRLIYLLIFPVFLIFRPLIGYKKCMTDMEVLNAAIQVAFVFFLYQYFSFKSLVYLFGGTVFALGSFHPVAGHLIAAHYVFSPDQDTYSYLGPVNYVTMNIGYHMEHHDFPFIPCSRLPRVREIAPEFYRDMHTHTSYIRLLWRFVTDPQMGTYARLKRQPRTEKQFYTGSCSVAEYAGAILRCLGYYQLKDLFVPRNEDVERPASG